jgi:TatD DNase family protein
MGSQEEAQTFLDLGFLISFTGNITFSDQLEEIVKYVPLKKILIETDAPYLAPTPHRGERNEPAYIIEVARKIAEIKKVPLVEVEKQTDRNAETLFKI